MPPRILAVAEVAEGSLTKLSTEVATVARKLAEAAGGEAVGLVVDAAPDQAAAELATYVPKVVAVTNPALSNEVAAPHVAAEVARLLEEGVTHVILGVSQDGRDVAGTPLGPTRLRPLAHPDSLRWRGGGPRSRPSRPP